MLSILAILFLSLGSFTQQTLASGPGTVTFTIDDSKYNNKSVELMEVEIKGKGCAQPTIVSPTLRETKQFTVNWKDCPEVNVAADLKDVEFHIKCLISVGQQKIIGGVTAELRKNTDKELKQFYAGGKATITFSANGRNNEVKFVEKDTSASHGNPSAFLTFTIDSKLSLPDPEAKIDKVQIYQKECPEEVKDAADLKHIGIVIIYSFGPNQGNLMLPRVQLEDCSGYLLNKLLVGGHAKILISEDGRNNKVKYVADKNGDPRNLTFTVDTHYLLSDGSTAKVVGAEVYQQESGVCEIAILPPNLKESTKFTVDWDSCPKKLNEFTDLDDIQIHVYLSHYKREGDRLIQPFALKDYSDGLLRHLFAGGEAEILINNNNDERKTHRDIKYVKHLNEINFAHPGLLTLNVEYENKDKKIITPLREVTIEHTAKEMAHCKPEEIKDSKFTVDLAKCKVHNIEDLLNLDIRFKFSVQNPHNPRRKLPKSISVPFSLLKNENVQKQFYEGGHAKIVLNDKDEPSLIHVRPNPPDPSAISHLEEELRKHLSAFAKTILPGSSSHYNSKPNTVKFTVHFQHAKQPDAKLESVEIFQNDEEWKLPVKKGSMEFTVDWNDCPVKVKNAADLKEIEILVTFAGRRKLHYPVYLNKNKNEELEKLFEDEELEKLFAGGEAKITITDDGTEKHTALEYVENPNAIGSSSHSSKPGTVKFTVPEGHGQFVAVEIFQKDDKVCETTMESNQFTVDWSKCEEKMEKAADLKHIEIEVTFAHGRRKTRESFFLKNNKDEELEKLFAGGEAKLGINGNHKTIEYVDSPNAIVFNVDYENRESVFFDQVEITSLTWDVDARCKPLLYEGGRKFSVNLANCGVKTAQDLPNLLFEIRFLLDHAPGKHAVKTLIRTASCYGQSAEELEKYFNGGEAKLVFFDPEKEKAMELLKNNNVASFFSLTYLYAPNKPAATSSHESSEKKTLWIELYVYPHLWQTEDKKKFIYHDNGHITQGYEEMKIVDEQNMKLRKDGVECPLRIAKHRRPRGDEFKFDIDWPECSAEIKSPKELDGMVLNITYQQGEKAAVKELHYTFTKSDPLHKIFENKLEFRLVEHEHGKVRPEKEGYKA